MVNRMTKCKYVKPTSLCVQAAPAANLLAGSGNQIGISNGQADDSKPILAPRADWSQPEDDGDTSTEW